MTIARSPINILLVDDHRIFLEGLCALIEGYDNINIIAKAHSGKEALELLNDEKIDIVVSDIGMPEMNGIELHALIKKKHPEIKTLVLSTYNDPDKIARLTRQGVNGYLLKNAEKEELLKAIQTIASGETYFSEEVKTKYMNSMFAGTVETEEQTPLSKREKEVLKCIAEEYTTQQIADKLFISQHTVNTHRKNLLAKLQVKNAAGLVKCAYQLGLMD